MTQKVDDQSNPSVASATSAELGLLGVEGGSWEWKYNDLRKRMENYLLREIDILEALKKEARRMDDHYSENEYLHRQGDLKSALSYFYAVTQDEKLENFEVTNED